MKRPMAPNMMKGGMNQGMMNPMMMNMMMNQMGGGMGMGMGMGMGGPPMKKPRPAMSPRPAQPSLSNGMAGQKHVNPTFPRERASTGADSVGEVRYESASSAESAVNMLDNQPLKG